MTHKNNLLKIIPGSLLALIFLPAPAQDKLYAEFYQKSMRTNNTGMYVLGSWAVANLIIGGIGWNQNTGDTKYFISFHFNYKCIGHF